MLSPSAAGHAVGAALRRSRKAGGRAGRWGQPRQQPHLPGGSWLSVPAHSSRRKQSALGTTVTTLRCFFGGGGGVNQSGRKPTGRWVSTWVDRGGRTHLGSRTSVVKVAVKTRARAAVDSSRTGQRSRGCQPARVRQSAGAWLGSRGRASRQASPLPPPARPRSLTCRAAQQAVQLVGQAEGACLNPAAALTCRARELSTHLIAQHASNPKWAPHLGHLNRVAGLRRGRRRVI